MKYIYPAIFTEEEEGGYSVDFPDIQGCFTCGDTLEEALYMANDVLSLILMDLEDNKKDIPAASDAKDISVNDDEFVSLVQSDTEQYRRSLRNKAVKKTLSIPEWMNEAAIAAGLNFSQVLQEALTQKLALR